MVTIINKLLLEFKNNFYDDKKILTIAKEDKKESARFIYYISNYRGTRISKKQRIRTSEYEKLTNQAINITQLF